MRMLASKNKAHARKIAKNYNEGKCATNPEMQPIAYKLNSLYV